MRPIAANTNTNNVGTQPIQTVGDLVLNRRCATFHPEEFIDDILPHLRKSKEGVAAVVDDEGELVGMLTERQILRRVFMQAMDPSINPARLRKYIRGMTVEQVMIIAPETLDEGIPLEEAVGTMLRWGYRFMPVVSRCDRRHLLGIVSEHEMAMHLKNRLQEVRKSEEEVKSMLSFMLREPYGVGAQLPN